MSTVCVAGARGFNFAIYFTVAKYPDATAGNPTWAADHGAQVNCIATDSAGNVYTGGVVSGGYTTRKYNSSGALQWSVNHGATVYGIAVDSSGNVYAGGDSGTGGYYLRKYNSSGALQWSKSGTYIYAVTVDSSGNVWAAGSRVDAYDSAGTAIFYGNLHAADLYAIAIDGSGNIYVAGAIASSKTTKKYNSAGTLQWSVNHGATVRGIAVDSGGNVYTAGIRVSNVTTRKYNSSGTEITTGFPLDHGADLYAIALGSDGSIYVAGAPYLTAYADKYDASGTLLYSLIPYGYVSVTAYGIALAASPDLTALPPGLPVKIALAIPATEKAFSVPALPIPLALALPTPTTPPVPPLGDGQTVYRCYLTGLPALVELPLQSLQCRKRYNESTWLNTVIASASLLTILPMLAAAKAAGGQLVIYAGLRNSAGAESMGEMLRATLTDYGYERTPGSLKITLDARVAAVLDSLQTRAMTGMVSRQVVDGRRQIRCTVNPRLRPGDTVDTGAETWVAHSITYFIGSNEAYMDVQEAL